MNTHSPGEAKRVALTLAAAQAVVGAAAPIAVSLGGLAGSYLLGVDKSLATAPVTGYNLGVALGALPAAALMSAVGRRNGFMIGTVATSLGGAFAALALMAGSFWLFALALVVIGSGGAFVQQYRFAAADNAPEHFRPRAIAWVLCGGIFGAIIGPQTVIYTSELLAPVMFAGSFVAIIGLGIVGAVILSFLRLRQPLPRQAAAQGPAQRPLGAILAQPRFIVGLACAVGSYAMMSFVMTGAPLAMQGCGFSIDQAALGIQWHVMAMFAPSSVTGRLISRFGREAVIATGLLLLTGCAAIAHSGVALWNFWLALVFLGAGWNFGFIGATAIVADTYRPSEKSKVQGAHDFILFGTVSFGSLMSGRVLNAFGWSWLNWTILPFAGLCLALLGWLVLTGRHRPVGRRIGSGPDDAEADIAMS